MAKEIERKFLVVGLEWQSAEPIYFSQGYLNRDKERTVRVRVAGDTGWLTIKGITKGATRDEFEYEIPLEDAQAMQLLCEQPLVEKNRRVVEFAGNSWEVDEFLGENEGLVVAEIELQSEDQTFEKPAWVGEEVTDDGRYYNSSLSKHPFRSWQQDS